MILGEWMDISKIVDADMLADAFLSLETREECMAFFEDVFTIAELRAVAQRLEVASLLRDGKNYNEIVSETGASSATVSRVSRCLTYGPGGYNTVFERIENKESK